MSDSNLEKIGALWKRQSKKGTNFLSGEIDGQKVLIFRTKEKRSDKSPDYQVFRGSDPQAPAKKAEPEAAPVITDDDIPF